MDNEERSKLVLHAIRLVNRYRAVEGLESLSDKELPLWKEILMDAPDPIFKNHLSIEKYMKEQIKLHMNQMAEK
jgi:hypothetical protein